MSQNAFGDINDNITRERKTQKGANSGYKICGSRPPGVLQGYEPPPWSEDFFDRGCPIKSNTLLHACRAALVLEL